MEPTTFATLFYSGLVVMVMDAGSTDNCHKLIDNIMDDITSAYADPDKSAELAESIFPNNEWFVTCEAQRLEVDTRYQAGGLR